jgi:aminoglycoside N3'-acetyltransferase
VLLLGVGHAPNTTIHVAELIAGVSYRLPGQITVVRDGQPVRIDFQENDHCCQRFGLADGWLRARSLQREGPVGSDQARLVASRDVVAVVTEQLATDPLVFPHPPDAGCRECDQSRSIIA